MTVIDGFPMTMGFPMMMGFSGIFYCVTRHFYAINYAVLCKSLFSVLTKHFSTIKAENFSTIFISVPDFERIC